MSVPSKGMEPVSAGWLRNNGRKAFMSIKQNRYHHLLFKTSIAEIKEIFTEKKSNIVWNFQQNSSYGKIIYFFWFLLKKIASNQQLVFTGAYRVGHICIRPYPLVRINQVPSRDRPGSPAPAPANPGFFGQPRPRPRFCRPKTGV